MNGLHEPTGIAFRTRNDGAAGRPIVFIHGAGGNKLVWLSLTRALAKTLPDRPLYMIDLPGHGDSSKPGRSSVDDYAADLGAFLADQTGFPVSLVGHSMGGAVSLTFSLDRPDDVDRVAIVASGYRLPDPSAIIQALEGDFELALSYVQEMSFAPGADPREAEQMVAGLRACGQRTVIDDFVACKAYDVKARVEGLRPPLAVFFGTRDLLTSEARNRALAVAVPGAVTHVFEGAGHMLPVERTAQVAARMTEFFAA